MASSQVGFYRSDIRPAQPQALKRRGQPCRAMKAGQGDSLPPTDASRSISSYKSCLLSCVSSHKTRIHGHRSTRHPGPTLLLRYTPARPEPGEDRTYHSPQYLPHRLTQHPVLEHSAAFWWAEGSASKLRPPLGWGVGSSLPLFIPKQFNLTTLKPLLPCPLGFSGHVKIPPLTLPLCLHQLQARSPGIKS